MDDLLGTPLQRSGSHKRFCWLRFEFVFEAIVVSDKRHFVATAFWSCIAKRRFVSDDKIDNSCAVIEATLTQRTIVRRCLKVQPSSETFFVTFVHNRVVGFVCGRFVTAIIATNRELIDSRFGRDSSATNRASSVHFSSSREFPFYTWRYRCAQRRSCPGHRAVTRGMIEADHFDEKLAGGGSGPICSASSPTQQSISSRFRTELRSLIGNTQFLYGEFPCR
jgi:hypothetical protein